MYIRDNVEWLRPSREKPSSKIDLLLYYYLHIYLITQTIYLKLMFHIKHHSCFIDTQCSYFHLNSESNAMIEFLILTK